MTTSRPVPGANHLGLVYRHKGGGTTYDPTFFRRWASIQEYERWNGYKIDPIGHSTDADIAEARARDENR